MSSRFSSSFPSCDTYVSGSLRSPNDLLHHSVGVIPPPIHPSSAQPGKGRSFSRLDQKKECVSLPNLLDWKWGIRWDTRNFHNLIASENHEFCCLAERGSIHIACPLLIAPTQRRRHQPRQMIHRNPLGPIWIKRDMG